MFPPQSGVLNSFGCLQLLCSSFDVIPFVKVAAVVWASRSNPKKAWPRAMFWSVFPDSFKGSGFIFNSYLFWVGFVYSLCLLGMDMYMYSWGFLFCLVGSPLPSFLVVGLNLGWCAYYQVTFKPPGFCTRTIQVSLLPFAVCFEVLYCNA